MGSPNVGENWALPISQPWVRYTSLLDRRRNLRARNKEQNLLRILRGIVAARECGHFTLLHGLGCDEVFVN